MTRYTVLHCNLDCTACQYWPARGTETYGVMCVTLTDTQELATYCIRTFQLQRVSSAHVSNPACYTSHINIVLLVISLPQWGSCKIVCLPVLIHCL